MPRSSGGRLVSEIGTAGHGGQNVICDENQNWWSLSSTSLPPLHTIKATKQQQKQLPSEQQNRNHYFIDCNSFTRLLNDNVICKSCVNAYVKEYCKQTVQDFVTYLQSDSAYHISINQKSESFLEKAFLSTEIPCIPQPLIAVSSENLGLASKIQITCLTCQKVIAKLESARSDNTKDNGEITNKEIEAKHFSINQQFILGCHEAGLGPGDADIICSAMNLPIPVGYWSTQGNFCAVEELVGKAQLETTALEMHKACDAEIYQTLNVHERVDWADKGHKFRGGSHYLLLNVQLCRICHA